MKEEIKILVQNLVEAEKLYDEQLDRINDGSIKLLLAFANRRKALHSKEIGRLFQIDLKELESSKNNTLDFAEDVNQASIKNWIATVEKDIMNQYERILSANKFDPVQTFVLKNHMKSQKIILDEVRS